MDLYTVQVTLGLRHVHPRGELTSTSSTSGPCRRTLETGGTNSISASPRIMAYAVSRSRWRPLRPQFFHTVHTLG